MATSRARSYARDRLIVVDAGGVVFHSDKHRNSVAAVLADASSASGYPLDQLRQHWKAHLQGPLWDGRQPEVWLWEQLACYADIPVNVGWASLVRETIAELVFDEALDALANLSTLSPVWMLSNQYGPWLRDALAQRGVDAFLERILVSSELRAAKPSPQAFSALCTAAPVPPDNIIFVDDKLANLEAAAGFGVNTCHSVNDPERWKTAALAFLAGPSR